MHKTILGKKIKNLKPSPSHNCKLNKRIRGNSSCCGGNAYIYCTEKVGYYKMVKDGRYRQSACDINEQVNCYFFINQKKLKLPATPRFSMQHQKPWSYGSYNYR